MFKICENHIYSDISIYNKRMILFKKNLLSKISSKHLIYTQKEECIMQDIFLEAIFKFHFFFI